MRNILLMWKYVSPWNCETSIYTNMFIYRYQSYCPVHQHGFSISFHDQSGEGSSFSVKERKQMNKIGTINQTPAVDKLVMHLSESGSVDESLDIPQADSNNATLQTWVLNSDAWWLCGHTGSNSLDDFIRPLSSLRPNQKCQPSKMFAAWESAVSGTPHPSFPPWETKGRRGEQTSPCSCPRVRV